MFGSQNDDTALILIDELKPTMASKIPNRTKKAPPKAHPFFKSKAVDPEQMRTRVQQAFAVNDFVQAQQVAFEFLRHYPQVAMAWADAAACCVHLEQWDETIRCAKKAIALDPSLLAPYDGLSHAYGAKRDWAQVKVFGSIALEQRNAQFGLKKIKEIPACVIPPFIPDPQRNVIAFSLFGGLSKYGETAVLNAIEQPRIYPNWSCRFYVDESVPAHILDRLKQHGASVVYVDQAHQRWPGPMWRMLAYDDPNVDRVIFRDADSVISEREAGAVAEWVASDLPFHMMRDSGSHTELILAGLWGCVRGSLPSMEWMIEDFLKVEPSSRHFADQFFLREYVWAYARDHILQHDSLFDFMGSKPFPEGPHRDDFHAGYAEGSSTFESAVNESLNGTAVIWSLWDYTQEPRQLVCSYPGVIQKGALRAHLPRRYTHKLKAKEYGITIAKARSD